MSVDSLLQHIQFRLATRKYCVLSERELERAWPLNEKRVAAITEFSQANNLSFIIREPRGTRVVFKKPAQR